MTVSLAKDAERCFTSAFGAVIIIICNAETNKSSLNTQSENASASKHDDDIIYVDGSHSPPLITSYSFKNAPQLPSNAQGYCTWRAAHSTLKRIFDSSRTLSNAFISGRLTISGDMAVMARLNIHQNTPL